MVHKVKIKATYAERIKEGLKTFEVRKNDRDYQVGDYLEFKVLLNDSWTEKIDHEHKLTGTKWKIVYIHSGYGMEDDFVILGLQRTGCIPRTAKKIIEDYITDNSMSKGSDEDDTTPTNV